MQENVSLTYSYSENYTLNSYHFYMLYELFLTWGPKHPPTYPHPTTRGSQKMFGEVYRPANGLTRYFKKSLHRLGSIYIFIFNERSTTVLRPERGSTSKEE